MRSTSCGEFYIKDSGTAKKIFRTEIYKDSTLSKLWLSHSSYLRKSFERLNMQIANQYTFSISFKLSTIKCPKIDDEVEYMSKVPCESAM